MGTTSSRVDGIKRTARRAVTRVRCENRFISRYVFNLRAVRAYRKESRVLSSQAAAVATELSSSGVALSRASDLTGDDAAFQEIIRYAHDLRASGTLEADASKPYLTELLGASPELEPGNPLLSFALDPQVRGIAESYSGMSLKVQDVNIWVNAPTPGSAQQSQRWHRDLPEDYDIVKCFVYLDDVTTGAGPLRYVRRSNTTEGRKMRFDTEFDGVGYRLDDSAVAKFFAEEDVVQATGPAGTVVFADTRGIHRGGLATERERVVLQITYASEACFRPRNLRAAPGVQPEQLADVKLRKR